MSEPEKAQLSSSQLRVQANVIRGLAIDAVEEAGHGHPGAAMGMADIAAVLYAKHLRFDGANPDWHDRDRVILSNGHASIFLYSLLYLTGVPGVELDDIKAFRKAGSKTPGHPEVGHTPGVEVTTGPLGQGLGMSVGMALAERRLRDEFGADVCSHRTWVFAGDGCLMEGVGQEAASLAGHLRLGHLNLLYDMNSITIDGSTDLSFSEDTAAKFKALGWHVVTACGHTHDEIDDALAAAIAETTRPSIILFRTTIGFGAPTKSGTSGVHGSKLGSDEAAAAKAALNLPAAKFEIPDDHLATWRAFGARNDAEHNAWRNRLAQLPKDTAASYDRRMSGQLPDDLGQLAQATKADWAQSKPKVATRKASQMALQVLTTHLPEMIGGSADLSGSNLTKTTAMSTVFSAEGSGRYVNYGVREFAMAAAMNGIAMHGGFVPYGGTFLVFSDYMRNAIRLSALMQARVIYIMTHDSIGLGEDGPTHQPVEHLASLRAIPGLHVFRPADAIETLEAYETALTLNAPSLFALSRQGTPALRTEATAENMVSRGGYLIRKPSGKRDLTILATGTEVAIALDAAEQLARESFEVAVVSLACWSLFDAQPKAYRDEILGDAPRMAVEAASSFGWTRYVESEDHVISVDRFGASASAETLYEEFGITAQAISDKCLRLLNNHRAQKSVQCQTGELA
ncbi:transketolase [Marinovum sp. 2_MG-2023]|uniref:transketolase n=1 Tax=unclassified Marinovum TaxID=2647166 RepID=UPI0026E1DC05|nr:MULTISPECIES: transketolase [unclassified Marinovum]MDO6732179.1 transketolase [Marinovum sp. 2_MG-2023]MDO6781496.1 transketolase [Marinovum sp. 1_MG-2023]